MLRLYAGQVESLWDEALPVEVKELPEDLAALDRLLSDPGLLEPIVARWRREVLETKRAVLTDGRPTIAMETYIRLMVLKQRFRSRPPRHSKTSRPSALHRWAPTARLPTHPTPPAALPHRCRRTHQPPQTRLRPPPQPSERR